VHEVKNRLDLTKYVESHHFSFDAVFGEKHTNAEVYAGTARPLVDALFQGSRCTCFAYGQTGTGKTHTMEGSPGNPGLYLLAVNDVFNRLREDPTLHVSISFFEIYGSRLHDLLNNRAKLEAREDSQCEVRIVGLTECRCSSVHEVLDLIGRAAASRSTGVTGANDDSSRSHAVFQIELRREGNRPPDLSLRAGDEAYATSTNHYTEIGRLSFIDLAGSERGSDTSNSNKLTRLEGAEINKSLLALKECIRAMDQRKDHTPFRGSKLTQVLKASFTGKASCQTVMIANVSPASQNVEHSLNTLRYSQRVKEMKSSSSDQSSSSAPAYTYGVPASRSGSLRPGSGNFGGRTGQHQDSVQVYQSSVTIIQSPENVPLKADVSVPPRQLHSQAEYSSSRTLAMNTTVQERRRSSGTYPSVSGKANAPPPGPPGGETGLTTADLMNESIEDASGRRDDRVTAELRSSRTLRRLTPMSRSMIPTPRASSGRRTTLSHKDDIALPQTEAPPTLPTGRSRGRASLMPAVVRDSSAKTFEREADIRDTRPRHTSHHRSRRPPDSEGQEVDPTGPDGFGEERIPLNNEAHAPLDAAHPRARGADLVRFNTLPSSVMRTTRSKSAAQNKPSAAGGSNFGKAAVADEPFDENLEEDEVLFQPTRAKKSPRKGNRLPFGSRNRRQESAGRAAIDKREYEDYPEEESYDDDDVASRTSTVSARESGISEETQRVISLHKEKAEELTKLMRDGIELMRAVEEGKVAPASYATKLELNLALSMDVIHTLKTHVASLGAQER
jgi:hypothetical protein